MKWLIFCILLLTCPLWGEGTTFESSEYHFKVVFHGPVKTAHPRSDQTTVGCAPTDKSRDWEAVSILTGSQRRSPLDTLNYLVSEGVVKSHPGKITDIRLDKVPGIEVSGLDERGYPFGLRILTTAQTTYVVMSCNMDLGKTQSFLKSFQLTGGDKAPEAKPKPAKARKPGA